MLKLRLLNLLVAVSAALTLAVGCTPAAPTSPTNPPATGVGAAATNTSAPRATSTTRPAATNTFLPPPTLLPATRAASNTPIARATTAPTLTNTRRATTAPTTAVTAAPTTAGSRLIVPTMAATRQADGLTRFPLPLGSGAGRGAWNVFFTAPSGSRTASTYVNGIDIPLALTIGGTRRTLDIVAFEWNNSLLTAAVLDAVARGVTVRMVVDSEHTFEDDDSTIEQLQAAGIPIVIDDRSAFMHNKFMIFDSTTVLTGSWNFTVNDTYRNNNNALYLRSPEAVALYQREFNEMFADGNFGPSDAVPSVNNAFTVNGANYEVYFSPDDEVLDRIVNAIAGARTSIRFMAFSFTEDSIGDALVARVARNSRVSVQGVFETTGSETRFSEMTKLFCAGMDVRQDGNPFTLHHKVFIIDSQIVLTGSFNFSANATNSNDENLVVIDDPAIAALYLEEYERVRAAASAPDVTCPS